LEIALKSQDIGHGDSVAIPGITFFATAEAVINVGATPVFVDVDPLTGLMDPASLERVGKEKKIKAVMPVHIYGLPAPMGKINSICSSHKWKIIEDGAQACGTFLPSGPVGSNKNALTTFSFYPTKNLSAMGDAGAILLHDDATAEKIKSLRNHGRGATGMVGRNSRCDHIQAAVLLLKLREIENQNKKRKEIARLYHEQLAQLPCRLLPRSYLETSSWHLYPIFLGDAQEREELQAFLTDSGIGSSPYYLLSMPQEEALQAYSGERKNADAMAGKALCLPIHPFMTERHVHEIALQIKSFYQ